MMRIVFVVMIALAASCGDNSPAPADGAGSGDLMSTKDMSTVPMTDGSGIKMFGDLCVVPGNPGDCAAGLICDMFVMNTIRRCTRLCDAAQPMNGCPPPSTGTCNGKGECKFAM